MNIRLTCCPSFKEGYSVGIFRDDGYRGKNKCFMKTGKLPSDSFIDAGNIDITFDRLTENVEIEASDYNELAALLDRLSLSPMDCDVAFMDGVSYFLHIDLYGSEMALAWNSIPPKSWSGINDLVQGIEKIINKYRSEHA